MRACNFLAFMNLCVYFYYIQFSIESSLINFSITFSFVNLSHHDSTGLLKYLILILHYSGLEYSQFYLALFLGGNALGGVVKMVIPDLLTTGIQ